MKPTVFTTLLDRFRTTADRRRRSATDVTDPGVVTTIVRLVADFGRDCVPGYGRAIALMMVGSACTAIIAWLMKDVINRIFVDRDQSALVWLPFAVVCVFTIKGLATYFQEVTIARIGNRIVSAMQQRLFAHMLRLNVAFFQNARSSDLVTLMTQNTSAARDLLNTVALAFGRDLMTVIGLVAVMVWQDPMLAAIALLGGPVVAVFVRRLVVRVKQTVSREMASTSSIVTTVREATQGIRIAKAYQLEPLLNASLERGTSDVEQTSNKVARIRARISPLMETMAGVVISLVILYAGWRNHAQGEPPGALFAFITALLLAAEPARRLARINIQMSAAAVAVNMLYQILDRDAVEQSRVDAKPLKVVDGRVEFRDVTFGYENEKLVLEAFSAVFEAGKTTALVGLSGSGKTTIFNLLQSFWVLPPKAGAILIDGQSIADVDVASLRSQIALVSQDVFLFEGTIGENIRAGTDASAEALRAAAKAAFADGFIGELPQGYDTPVGELGSRLSGGQRQRISIARAFLKNAPIILLDEPTSALDSEAERAIQDALAGLTRGRTTIVVAHRLSTIQQADRIHVLDQGRLVESDTHHKLLANGGLYARLHRLQFEAPPATIAAQ